jgi:peroxiredoxin
MVAAGAPGLTTGGGGWGAKFWAAAGPTAASAMTVTNSTRGMLYYRHMRRALLTIAVVLCVAAAAYAAPAAPGFRVTTLDGTKIDSKELIGKKVVVLRFQASYCKPCVKESPAFSKVVERYRDRDVEFVAVHVQDTATDTQRFAKRTKATYPIAMDPRLNLGNRFGFKGTPYTVVIDKKGEMVVQYHGENAATRLPRTLDSLLKPDQS